MKKSFLVFGLIVVLSQLCLAKDQAATEFFLCKNQDDVRILSILMNGEKSCVAHYSKKGKDEIIAQAKSPELCHDRLKQLRGILKSANYNCKSVARAQVTSSAEATQQ